MLKFDNRISDNLFRNHLQLLIAVLLALVGLSLAFMGYQSMTSNDNGPSKFHKSYLDLNLEDTGTYSISDNQLQQLTTESLQGIAEVDTNSIGRAIAFASSGLMAVSAFHVDGHGIVFIMAKNNNGGWQKVKSFVGTDVGTTNSAGFGASLAFDGDDTLAIGNTDYSIARGTTDLDDTIKFAFANGKNAGAVHIVRRNLNNIHWSSFTATTPSQLIGQSNSFFGTSVSFSSTGILAVGSPGVHNDVHAGSCSAYELVVPIYESIANLADAIVHQCGRVDLYSQTSNVWSKMAKQLPGPSSIDSDENFEYNAFGTSVAFSSDGLQLAVGAPQAEGTLHYTGYNNPVPTTAPNYTEITGAVYVFKANASGDWQKSKAIKDETTFQYVEINGAPQHLLDEDGNQVYIPADLDSDGNPTGVPQYQTIDPPVQTANHLFLEHLGHFGEGLVFVDDDKLAVAGARSGTIYMLDRQTNNDWQATSDHITVADFPSLLSSNHTFGSSMAYLDGQLVIGDSAVNLVNVFGLDGLVDSSWKYVVIELDGVCDASLFANAGEPYIEGQDIALTYADHHAKRLCFEITETDSGSKHYTVTEAIDLVLFDYQAASLSISSDERIVTIDLGKASPELESRIDEGWINDNFKLAYQKQDGTFSQPVDLGINDDDIGYSLESVERVDGNTVIKVRLAKQVTDANNISFANYFPDTPVVYRQWMVELGEELAIEREIEHYTNDLGATVAQVDGPSGTYLVATDDLSYINDPLDGSGWYYWLIDDDSKSDRHDNCYSDDIAAGTGGVAYTEADEIPLTEEMNGSWFCFAVTDTITFQVVKVVKAIQGINYGAPPTITSLEVTSTPRVPDDGGPEGYGVNETVIIVVHLSEAITIDTTGGQPQLRLSNAGIAYYSQTSFDKLSQSFIYRVSNGEHTDSLNVDSFAANGSVIKDVGDNLLDVSLPAGQNLSDPDPVAILFGTDWLVLKISLGDVPNSYQATAAYSGSALETNKLIKYIFVGGEVEGSGVSSHCNATKDSELNNGATYTEGTDITYTAANNGQRICFRATSTVASGGLTDDDYKDYQTSPLIAFASPADTDSTAPEIVVSSVIDNQVSATATDTVDSSPTLEAATLLSAYLSCNSQVTFAPYTAGSVIDLEPGQRACFRATDDATNQSYAASTVGQIITAPPVIVDTTSPQIVVSAVVDNQVSAIVSDNVDAADAITFEYQKVDDVVNCDAALTTTFAPYTSPDLLDLAVDEKACFKATDTSNNTDYAASTVGLVVVVDVLPPNILIDGLINNVTRARATDDADPNPELELAKISGAVDCNDQVTGFASYTAGDDVSLAVGQKACFRATDDASRTRYAASTTAIVLATTDPDVVVINDYHAVTNALTVTASASDDTGKITVFEVQKIDTDTTCGDSLQAGFNAYTADTTISDLGFDQKACFKATGNSGLTGYQDSDSSRKVTITHLFARESHYKVAREVTIYVRLSAEILDLVTTTAPFPELELNNNTVAYYQADQSTDDQLAFVYRVVAGDDNTAGLQVSAFNVNGADIGTVSEPVDLDTSLPAAGLQASYTDQVPVAVVIDTIKPVISIDTFNRSKAKASVHDADPDVDFKVAVIADTELCDSTIRVPIGQSDPFNNYRSGRSVNLSAGEIACFKAKDQAGNQTYQASVDVMPPSITVNPLTETSVASATVRDNRDDDPSFYAVVIDAEADCDDQVSSFATYVADDDVLLAIDQKACFKAVDADDNEAYAASDAFFVGARIQSVTATGTKLLTLARPVYITVNFDGPIVINSQSGLEPELELNTGRIIPVLKTGSPEDNQIIFEYVAKVGDMTPGLDTPATSDDQYLRAIRLIVAEPGLVVDENGDDVLLTVPTDNNIVKDVIVDARVSQVTVENPTDLDTVTSSKTFRATDNFTDNDDYSLIYGVDSNGLISSSYIFEYYFIPQADVSQNGTDQAEAECARNHLFYPLSQRYGYTEGQALVVEDTYNDHYICFRSRRGDIRFWNANEADYGGKLSELITNITTPRPTVTVSAGTASDSFKAVDDDGGTTTWLRQFIDDKRSCDGHLDWSAADTYQEASDVNPLVGNNNQKLCFQSTNSQGFAGYDVSEAIVTDSLVPTISQVQGSSGYYTVGDAITIIVTASESITVDVSNGQPSLSLDTGGVATYVSYDDTSNQLVFSYTVAANHNSADVNVVSFDLNGAVINDRAGNSLDSGLPVGANLADVSQLVVDTSSPQITVSAVSNNQVRAIVNDNLDADPSLEVVVIDGAEVCDATTADFEAYTAGTAVRLEVGQKACFRATDHLDYAQTAASTVGLVLPPPAEPPVDDDASDDDQPADDADDDASDDDQPADDTTSDDSTPPSQIPDLNDDGGNATGYIVGIIAFALVFTLIARSRRSSTRSRR